MDGSSSRPRPGRSSGDAAENWALEGHLDEDERVVEAIETNLGKFEGAIFRAGKGARRAQAGPRQHGGQAERSFRKVSRVRGTRPIGLAKSVTVSGLAGGRSSRSVQVQGRSIPFT